MTVCWTTNMSCNGNISRRRLVTPDDIDQAIANAEEIGGKTIRELEQTWRIPERTLPECLTSVIEENRNAEVAKIAEKVMCIIQGMNPNPQDEDEENNDEIFEQFQQKLMMSEIGSQIMSLMKWCY